MVRVGPLATIDPPGSYLSRDAEAGPWPRSRPHPADGDFGENSGAAGGARAACGAPAYPRSHVRPAADMKTPWGFTQGACASSTEPKPIVA